MKIFAELKQRHVFKIGLAYLFVAWIVAQVVSVAVPLLAVPQWVGSAIMLLLIAGFPIALVLAWAFEITPDGIKRADFASQGSAAPVVSNGRKLDFFIIAALAVALGYFVWNSHTATDAVQSETSSIIPAAETPSLAVLPFVNLSSDPEQEYFSDGLSEELLNHLAQIKGLRLTGRTSSFVFKGHNEDLRSIGEKLGVGNILEGSVRKSGNRLRITAQLVNAADGYHIWSETYDRELDDVFAIQEEVALAVTAALGIALGVGDGALPLGGTTNLEAFDKYLRARALFYQSGSSSRIVEIYHEALALDPKFALAWYGLYTALAYNLVIRTNNLEVRREMEEARSQILALAPDAWWTQAMLADQYLQQHRWSDAEDSASAALASAPLSAVDALVTYATIQIAVGRINVAVDTIQRAKDVEPLSLRISGLLQLFLDVAGRPADADLEFQRSADLAGGHDRWEWAALLRMWANQGNSLPEIRSRYRQFLATSAPVQRPLDTVLVELLDQPAAARAEVHRVFDDPAYQSAGGMTLIFLYADLLGDENLALAALHRAFVDFNKVNFEGLWWPFVTELRKDQRFKEIVTKIGLADYWRSTGNWGDFARPLGINDFELIR